MPQLPSGSRSPNLPSPSTMGDDDRVWQCFTIDQRWVCPYCLGAYHPNSRHPHGLRSFMQQHLHQQCPAFNQGRGRRHGLTELQHRVHLFNIEYHARNDRAWQIFDHEGFWFSPCSLQRIDSVQLINRRFDSSTVQRMAEHLLHCPYYRQGIVHPVETVQQARDTFSRIGGLARNLQRVVGQPIWQYRDPQQQWICPYCLVHLPDVPMIDPQQPGAFCGVVANHLLNQCPVYSKNPRGIRNEAAVRQAASTSPPRQGGFGLGGRLPSNPELQLTPLQENTPLQTMSLTPVGPLPTHPGTSPFGHTPATGVPLTGGFTPSGGSPMLTPGTGHIALEPGSQRTPQPGADASTGVRIAKPMGTGHYRRRSSAEDLTSARIVRPGHSGDTPAGGNRQASEQSTDPRVVQGQRQATSRMGEPPAGIRTATPVARPISAPPPQQQAPQQRRTPPPQQPPPPPPEEPEEDPFGSEGVEADLDWMKSDPAIPALNEDAEDLQSDDLMPHEDAMAKAKASDSYEPEPDESAEIRMPTPAPARRDDAGRNLSSADFAWMDDAEDLDLNRSHERVRALKSDVLRAADVQRTLLRDSPKLPGFCFDTRFVSASEVSGDCYEFVQLPDGRIGFALGDVSGHGMGAGLIMSMAKKVFSLYAKKEDSPRQVLTQVNDALADDLDGKRFITLTYAILDPAHRRITWCRAGHNPTLAYNLHTEELNEIKPPGMVLGMKQGSVFCESLLEEVTELRSGDVFLLFTDGVTEAMNRQGEEYGMERLREVLTNHAVHAPHDPGHMLDRVLDSVRHFRGGTDNLDDMALLALTVD